MFGSGGTRKTDLPEGLPGAPYTCKFGGESRGPLFPMKIWIWDLRRCNFLLSWRDYFSLFLLLSRYSITFSILPPLSQPYFHATLGELRDPYFQNVGYVPQDPPVAPPVVRFKGETAGGPVSDVYPGPQSGSQRAWHYLASMVIELNLVYERKFVMFSHCLKFHQIIHDTTASMHQQVLAKGYPGFLAYRML